MSQLMKIKEVFIIVVSIKNVSTWPDGRMGSQQDQLANCHPWGKVGVHN